jgi:hypothetical protein
MTTDMFQLSQTPPGLFLIHNKKTQETIKQTNKQTNKQTKKQTNILQGLNL